MLLLYPEITYFSYGTEDGTFLGCEATQNVTDNTQQLWWHATVDASDKKNLTSRGTWLVDPAQNFANYKYVKGKAGYDPRKRTWYMKNDGDNFWTPPYVYSDTTKVAYAAGVLVRAPGAVALTGIFTSDYVIAVIDPRVTVRVVSTLLSEIPTGKTGFSMAVNVAAGEVVGVSWKESLLAIDAVTNASRLKRMEDIEAHRPVLKKLGGTSQALKAYPRGFSTVFPNGATTDTWISVFDISDSSGIRWTVIVSIPDSDFLTEIRDQRTINIIIVVIVFVIVVILGIVVRGLRGQRGLKDPRVARGARPKGPAPPVGSVGWR